jgi:hypothetical protein
MVTKQCIHCNYQRLPRDIIVPDWQCPCCKKAYPRDSSDSTDGSFGANRYRQIQMILWILLALMSVLFLMIYFQPKYRIPLSQIKPELQSEPLQTKTSELPFPFDYRGKSYNAIPVANYELWGLVVSHNNINKLGDIYHDADSVDTKDLCVIWGENVRREDFHRVKFTSGSWTCYFRYPSGVAFRANQLSNNHLITDSDEIRKQIAKVRIGDQVHIRGVLVNYRQRSSRQGWRNSSTTRDDTGNGACEVIFVRELDIISRGNAINYFLSDLFFWLAILLLALKILLLIIEIYRTPMRRSQILSLSPQK